MKELKFRCWNKKKMQMEYPKCFCIPQGGNVVGLDDIIPMQYTGLHDKNGKEIYEGDILHTYEDILSTVCLKKEGAPDWPKKLNEHDEYFDKWYEEVPLKAQCYVEMKDGDYEYKIYERFLNDEDDEWDEDESDEVSLYNPSELKIIGNIYENPELF